MYTVTSLYDLEHTQAKQYLAGFEYPWQALKGISAFIQELGLERAHAYLLPASISAVYLGAAIAYYGIGIEKSLNGLTI